MKYYYDYLKNNNFKVKYLKYSDTFQVKKYLIFDPIDKIKLPGNFIVKESPNFLLTKDIYAKYRKKQINSFLMLFICLVKKR